MAAISRLEVLLQLARISTSDTFDGLTKKTPLLRFLVEAALEGKELTELTIFTDFFHQPKEDFGPDVSTVRAHISQLRKHLATYYATEGKRDSVVIEIPPGTYNPQITHSRPASWYGERITPGFDPPKDKSSLVSAHMSKLDEMGRLHMPPLFRHWLENFQLEGKPWLPYTEVFASTLDGLTGFIIPYMLMDQFSPYITSKVMDLGLVVRVERPDVRLFSYASRMERHGLVQIGEQLINILGLEVDEPYNKARVWHCGTHISFCALHIYKALHTPIWSPSILDQLAELDVDVGQALAFMEAIEAQETIIDASEDERLAGEEEDPSGA